MHSYEAVLAPSLLYSTLLFGQKLSVRFTGRGRWRRLKRRRRGRIYRRWLCLLCFLLLNSISFKLVSRCRSCFQVAGFFLPELSVSNSQAPASAGTLLKVLCSISVGPSPKPLQFLSFPVLPSLFLLTVLLQPLFPPQLSVVASSLLFPPL